MIDSDNISLKLAAQSVLPIAVMIPNYESVEVEIQAINVLMR